MQHGALGGQFYSFLFTEIYGVVAMLFGMRQVIEQLSNQNFGMIFFTTSQALWIILNPFDGDIHIFIIILIQFSMTL